MPAIEAEELSRIAERLAAAVREAGALALSMFGTPLKNWTKGPTSSPVSEADIAVDKLLRERLTGGGDGFAWLSEESADDSGAACRPPCVDRRSDRRHARLYRRPAGLGGVGGADRGRPADRGLPLCAGDGGVLHGAGRRRRYPQRRADCGDARVRTLKTPASPGRAISWNGSPPWCRHSPSCRGCDRWRSASRASRKATCDVAFAGGNSHDWDLAAADLLVHEAGGTLTAFGGGTVTYNRPVPRHGMLVAAGRDRHAALIELLGDGRLAFS